jgi:hypothetical protein
MVLPNGDDLETGVFNKEGIPTQYEEVWRDATTEMGGYGAAWIIQSSDGSTFLGRIGRMFIAMRQSPRGFAVRREALSESSEHWVLIFEDGPTRNLPRAVDVISAVNCDMEIGGKLTVQNAEFLIRGFGIV